MLKKPYSIFLPDYYPPDIRKSSNMSLVDFLDYNINNISELIYPQGYSGPGMVKPFPYVEFKILMDEDTIRARALKIDGTRYVVSLSVYALAVVIDLFNRMLSHQELFKEIGNCEEELVNEPSLVNFGILELKGVTPKNTDRKLFAAGMIRHSLIFMFLHELSHILNGHCDLKQELTPLQKRTLEMDADSSAMCILLKTIIDNSRNYNMPLDNQLKYGFFACYTLMRLCYGSTENNFVKENEYNQNSNNHPSWRLRQYMLIETALTYVEQKTKEIDYNLFEKNAAEMSNYLEIAYNKLTGRAGIIEINHHPHIAHFSSPEVTAYLDEWRNLHPLLEPLAYRKLVPPRIR